MGLRRADLGVVFALVVLVTGCSGADADENDPSAEGSTCEPGNLPLRTEGKLTIGTDDPAYEPWFATDEPSNGKGFESAVAYAVAGELGVGAADVTWVKVPFNSSYLPGDKAFDFDINQISITDERARDVDFSEPYYEVAQAVIALKDSELNGAMSLAELADARIGAQKGTTSLDAIAQIDPAAAPLVYDDTTKAARALQDGEADAIVADLPSAYYLTSSEIDDATIVGQFPFAAGESEQFGLLLEKDSALTPCVDAALATLKADGTLDRLQKEWLSWATDVPDLS